MGDNYYAALNSAVFSDGSFVYIPKGVKSSMELSTYFRINAQETGQVGQHLPFTPPAHQSEHDLACTPNACLAYTMHVQGCGICSESSVQSLP